MPEWAATLRRVIPGALELSETSKEIKAEMRQAMRVFHISAIALFCLAHCLGQKPPVTLKIQLAGSSFTKGTPIKLDVVVKNISKKEVNVWKASPQVDGEAEAYVHVEVRDSAGKALFRIDGVTIVRNGKKYTFPKPWNTRKGVSVAPRRTLRDFLLLSNLFDLSKPGLYIVSAKLEDAWPDSGPEMKLWDADSNQIRFKIKQLRPK
jgi:hypothetical protein